MLSQNDQFWMQAALELAQKAFQEQEVPVGAVLVQEGQIIGRGYNQSIQCQDPTAHAEIQALRDASKKLNNYRLPDTTLYVTLEPCLMCAGALVHARIKRLVFAASDPKTGTIHSVEQALEKPFHNHKIEYDNGILEDEASQLLKSFFQLRR